jgi:hypothetical protein
MALAPEQQILGSTPELQDVNRQRKLAELLMAQGMQQPQGQMISGYYVAPSFAQQLNPLANILAGQAVGERADTKQNQMATALRVQGDKAAQDVMQTYKQDPQLALQKAAQYQQFPQVKALLPQLSKVALVEPIKPTTDMQNYEFARSQGYKGSLNDFKNQITPYQQAQLGMEREKFEFEKTKSAIKPLPEGLNKQVTGSINLSDAITDYQSKIKGFGVKDFANPDKRAEMGNAYNNMMLQAKEAYNLGVLNGPDYEILQKVVRDPTNPSSLLFTNKALDRQAENLRTTAKNIVNTAYISQGRDVPADIAKKLVKPEIATETKNFASEQDVQKAIQGGTLKKGEKVIVNGVTGTIQ